VAGVEVHTLTDGGQPAEQTAHALAEFCAAAKQTLEIAVYDFRLPPELNDIVRDALSEAEKRGVAVRLAYNLDHAALKASAAKPAQPR
jgi:sugar/nucleoside kinase (ribokinase family)